jgi:hypothetical protein
MAVQLPCTVTVRRPLVQARPLSDRPARHRNVQRSSRVQSRRASEQCDSGPGVWCRRNGKERWPPAKPQLLTSPTALPHATGRGGWPSRLAEVFLRGSPLGPLSTWRSQFSWCRTNTSCAFSKLRTVKANRQPDDDERHLRSTSRICVQIHLCWWEGSFECLPSRPQLRERPAKLQPRSVLRARPRPETEAETKPSPTPVPRRASPETFFSTPGWCREDYHLIEPRHSIELHAQGMHRRFRRKSADFLRSFTHRFCCCRRTLRTASAMHSGSSSVTAALLLPYPQSLV